MAKEKDDSHAIPPDKEGKIKVTKVQVNYEDPHPKPASPEWWKNAKPVVIALVVGLAFGLAHNRDTSSTTDGTARIQTDHKSIWDRIAGYGSQAPRSTAGHRRQVSSLEAARASDTCDSTIRGVLLTPEPQRLPEECRMDFDVDKGIVRFIAADGRTLRIPAGQTGTVWPAGFKAIKIEAVTVQAVFSARFY